MVNYEELRTIYLTNKVFALVGEEEIADVKRSKALN